MPIRYKVDILEALKAVGYTTYKIRMENILGQSALQQIRRGEMVSWANIEKLCYLLNCQPGDILEYPSFMEQVENAEQKKKKQGSEGDGDRHPGKPTPGIDEFS